MLCRTLAVLSTLIALAASTVAVEPNKRPPPRIFRNLPDYLAGVYDHTPDHWAGTKDAFQTEILAGKNGIVGGMVGKTPDIARFCEESPKTTNDLDGIVTLFDWYMGKKQNPAVLRAIFHGYTGDKAAPDTIYCDQHVLIFRTLLAHRGFLSRPVIFDFTDGPGAASHTFLEVWEPRAGKWLWFDPYYEAYSRTLSTAELVVGDRGLTSQITVWCPKDISSEAERTKQIAKKTDTMVRQFWGKQPSGWEPGEPAWALWYVENAKTGERIEYHDPKYYKAATIAPEGLHRD
jgi:hypothetical protein